MTLLILSLLPYIYFGLSDNWHHFRHRLERVVTTTEKFLHAAIVISLFVIIPHAIEGNRMIMLLGLGIFINARTLDEFCFHRNLPAPEADIHAKTHWAFLIFVMSVLLVDHLLPVTQGIVQVARE